MNTELIDAIQEPIMGLLGLGLSFMALFIIYRAFQFKNREKLALIEKGMDPTLADAKPKQNQNNLKHGLMLIGIGLGVAIGYVLNLLFEIPNYVSYSTSILFSCGILLVYFHQSSRDRL